MHICKVFKLICSKVYDPSKYQDLRSSPIYSLCFLKKVSPTSLKNLMVHLVVHLVDELDLCGLVHTY
jgi:hypothetical protein